MLASEILSPARVLGKDPPPGTYSDAALLSLLDLVCLDVITQVKFPFARISTPTVAGVGAYQLPETPIDDGTGCVWLNGQLLVKTDIATLQGQQIGNFDSTGFGAANANSDGPAANGTAGRSGGLRSVAVVPAPDPAAGLNPRYTFEGFVIGASNRFAHAATLAVAERPAKSWNPLFIYGGPGLGKTHLLHAIGHFVTENYPQYKVRYASAETFTNEFIDALRSNTANNFKRRYRECDVLLIDDIQFMEGKESTKEEFFHTFNILHEGGHQIVITSDRPPKSLSDLEDRLRSRFEMGLVTDVQPPELETRLAILRKKAEREPLPVPNEVLEFIATNVTDNIRVLEGALIRVSAFASLNHEPLDEELARRVLADLFAGDQPKAITPKLILDSTANHFGFTVEELCGTSRRRPLVTARQIGMYAFRDLTDFSYPAIAREFGGRDHTTVIYAVEKVGTLMREKRAIYDQVTELIRVIRRGG